MIGSSSFGAAGKGASCNSSASAHSSIGLVSIVTTAAMLRLLLKV